MVEVWSIYGNPFWKKHLYNLVECQSCNIFIWTEALRSALWISIINHWIGHKNITAFLFETLWEGKWTNFFSERPVGKYLLQAFVHYIEGSFFSLWVRPILLWLIWMISIPSHNLFTHPGVHCSKVSKSSFWDSMLHKSFTFHKIKEGFLPYNLTNGLSNWGSRNKNT